MHPVVYDACRLLGLALTVVGCFMMWGGGPALICAGAGMIALTETGARR